MRTPAAVLLLLALAGCGESCDMGSRFVRSCGTTCGAAGVLYVNYRNDECMCREGGPGKVAP